MIGPPSVVAMLFDFPSGLMFCDASESASALSPRASRLLDVGVVVPLREIPRRVPLVVPVLIVQRPAHRVGAAARHHRDAEAGAVPERRVEVRRLDAHFLDHVGVRRRGEAPIAAVVGRAVDRPFVAAHAAGRRRVARRAVDEPLRDIRHGGRRVDAGDEPRQQHGHVREHRQALDAAPIEVLPGREDAGLENRRLAADRDGFADGADAQRQVDGGLLRDRQDDAAAHRRLEALQLGAHTVVPGQQQRRLVVAGRVRRQRRRDVRVDVGDRHGDAGHRATLLVEHMAGDRPARFLREGGGGEDEHQREHAANRREIMFVLLRQGRFSSGRRSRGKGQRSRG